MNNILTVKSLCKKYEKFSLYNVSFSLEKGKITGFIGRNGAGKTTTLKSLLNFVHPDSADIKFFGKTFDEAEKFLLFLFHFSETASNKFRQIRQEWMQTQQCLE